MGIQVFIYFFFTFKILIFSLFTINDIKINDLNTLSSKNSLTNDLTNDLEVSAYRESGKLISNLFTNNIDTVDSISINNRYAEAYQGIHIAKICVVLTVAVWVPWQKIITRKSNNKNEK